MINLRSPQIHGDENRFNRELKEFCQSLVKAVNDNHLVGDNVTTSINAGVVSANAVDSIPRDFDVIFLESKYNSMRIRGGSIKHIFNDDIEKLDETIYLEDATQDVVDYDEDGEASFFIYLTLTKNFLSAGVSFVVSSETLQDSYPLLLNFKLYKMIKKKIETEEGDEYAFFVERDCRTSYIYYTFS